MRQESTSSRRTFSYFDISHVVTQIGDKYGLGLAYGCDDMKVSGATQRPADVIRFRNQILQVDVELVKRAHEEGNTGHFFFTSASPHYSGRATFRGHLRSFAEKRR